MNKKVLLLTILVAISPVVQVVASAESMFRDINNISDNNIDNIDLTSFWYEIAKDQQTGRSDLQRFLDLGSVLSTMRWYRDIMQNKIAIAYEDKIAVLNNIILELENIETRLEERVRQTVVTNNTKEHIDYLFVEDSE